MRLFLVLVGIADLTAALTILAGMVYTTSWIVMLVAPPGVPVFTPIAQWGAMIAGRINATYEPHWIILGISILAILTHALLGSILLIAENHSATRRD